jgi:hypothetical protein
VLSLDSERWRGLKHAYGTAEDIPVLLRQLRTLPTSEGESEPWFTLWSSLAHQGDVYSASFAAVPHVVEALSSAPLKADSSYFQFPAWVEICRAKKQVAIPEDLQAAYVQSLSRLPALVATASSRRFEPDFLACTLAAIAVAQNQPTIAEAVLEITSSDIAQEFNEWFLER